MPCDRCLPKSEANQFYEAATSIPPGNAEFFQILHVPIEVPFDFGVSSAYITKIYLSVEYFAERVFIMLNIGIAEEIITPPRGITLAGYFNRRPNRGMYDDTKVRAVVFEKDGTVAGLVVLDVCTIGAELFSRILDGIAAEGLDFGKNLIVCANHTHTGTGQSSAIRDEAVEPTAAKTVSAVVRAWRNLAPGEIEFASVEKNPCAFVRRYWMKDGSVATNPGKLNPDIVGPESDFDRKVNVIAFKQEERIIALAVNLANHGDTIGGDLVSADWMGRLERELQIAIGEDVMVMTPMNASGDINHFDVSTARGQTSYAEAKRIGREYGQVVMEALKSLRPVVFDQIVVKNSDFRYYSRTVSAEKLAEARRILAETDSGAVHGDLTSEGLVGGDPAVLRHFARRIVDCAEKSVSFRTCRLTAIEFDRELALISLPGEPFNGISRAIQAKSPFRYTVVIELAQSQAAYTPMPECFERGGYETMPGVDTSAEDNAPRMITAALENL